MYPILMSSAAKNTRATVKAWPRCRNAMGETRPGARLSRWALVLAVVTSGGSGCVPRPTQFRTGLDVLAASGFASLKGKRVGVVVNPTSVDSNQRSLPELLRAAHGVELAAIFGPEHGASGSRAAGEKVADSRDRISSVRIYSLYGETRRPTKAMLEGLDVILFDLQDIGVRTYTYFSTLVEVLEAAREQGRGEDLEVWVLDRPNPLGGEVVEGPVLDPGLESFVGAHPVPLRHGLTLGELALLVNEEKSLGVKLRVLPAEGWSRSQLGGDTGLLWVPPSPNLPTVETAHLYAGFVLVEGTTLSEGRGTALPFHVAGAPWLDAVKLAAVLNEMRLPGCVFRAMELTPASSKHQGQVCQYVQTHVTAPRVFSSVRAAVALIWHAKRLHPKELAFSTDFFDRLAGTPKLREALESGTPLDEIFASWAPALEEFRKRREKYLLYR